MNHYVFGTLSSTPFGAAKPIPTDFLSAIHHSDTVSLVAVQRASATLALSADDGTVTDQDLLDLARSFVTWHLGWEKQLSRIRGPKEIATRFVEAVFQAAKEHGLHFKTEQELVMRQFALQDIISPKVPLQGTLRLATDDDLDFLTDWFQAFFRDSDMPLHLNGDRKYFRNIAYRGISRGFVYLYELSIYGDKPLPVSMASKIRPYRQSTSISHVYTPAPFRQRGYAGACVRALCQRLREVEGYESIVLFADENNVVTGPMYMRMGFVDIGLVLGYKFAATEVQAAV